jgi:hydrogenase/urease accessory protein HupE
VAGVGHQELSELHVGLTLILLGSAVALTAKLPRALGYLMGLSGLAYIVQGWVLGSEGFPATNTFAILAGYVLILAWIIWLVVVAWRTKESFRAPTR